MQNMQCYWPPTGARQKLKRRSIPNPSTWKVYLILQLKQVRVRVKDLILEVYFVFARKWPYSLYASYNFIFLCR